MPTCRIHWLSSLLGVTYTLVLSCAGFLQAQESAGHLAPTHLGSLPGVLRLAPLSGETESPVITAMSLSPDGRWMAVAGDDHAIRLLSLRDDGVHHLLVGHRDWVKGLSFSPTGNLLASCGHDGSLRLWNLAGTERSVFELAEQQVGHALFAVAFGSDTEVYTAGFGESIYRLDVSKDELEIALRCDCRDIRALDCSRDGRWLAFGGRDGIIRMMSLRREDHALAASPTPPPPRPKVITSPSLHFARIHAIHFSEDGQSLFSVGEDRRLVQWDTRSHTIVAQMDIQAGKLMTVCPLDRDLVAVSGSDNTIRIVDMKRLAIVSKLVGHDGSIATLQCNAKYLFSGSYDTSIRSWEIEQAMHQIDDAGRFVHPIAAQFEDSSSHERIR